MDVVDNYVDVFFVIVIDEVVIGESMQKFVEFYLVCEAIVAIRSL